MFDIEMSPRQTCLHCRLPLVNQICSRCPNLSGVTQLILGVREAKLRTIVDAYKFSHKRESKRVLATLLDLHTPLLQGSVTLVPIPTASSHIRTRGYDHMKLLCREFCGARGYKFDSIIHRNHNLRQFGATHAQRMSQAKTAFRCDEQLDPEKLYVICDDIVTTGATVVSAAKLLRSRGADKLVILALAQQPWK